MNYKNKTVTLGLIFALACAIGTSNAMNNADACDERLVIEEIVKTRNPRNILGSKAFKGLCKSYLKNDNNPGTLNYLVFETLDTVPQSARSYRDRFRRSNLRTIARQEEVRSLVDMFCKRFKNKEGFLMTLFNRLEKANSRYTDSVGVLIGMLLLKREERPPSVLQTANAYASGSRSGREASRLVRYLASCGIAEAQLLLSYSNPYAKEVSFEEQDESGLRSAVRPLLEAYTRGDDAKIDEYGATVQRICNQ